jgi:hypothetical protein
MKSGMDRDREISPLERQTERAEGWMEKKRPKR